MAEALISVLLDQLATITLQQAEQEVKLVVGVDKQVGKLTSNLQTIQAVLEDAERRQVKEATVKQWLAKLKDVSYDMDDVLDEWNTAILKMQIEGDENAPRPKRKVCSFIISCFCCRQVALRRGIAIKIKNINERLDVVASEKDRYNFVSQMTAPVVDVSRMTASVVDVSEVHGRDQGRKKIVDMLLSESSQGPTLRILSIVGMGGIGKTTLAQLVYNDDMVNAHFQKRIWVCVSDPFDEIRIAKAILESFKDDVRNLNELDSLLRLNELDPLLRGIRHFVEGKKFLLILDDVWTEDYKRWEQLNNSLNCGSPGSRILVTTRKEIVAKIIGTRATDIFPLETLSNEDCWSLFSQVAFFEQTSEEREKLEGIGRKIVEKCKGLPLAVKTLGSLLRFKNTREEWQSVLNSEVWKLEGVEKGLFPPLLLSYYDLSSTLRRCFSYCAIFPKDYMLERDRLIKLWMAQGYLRATDGKDMEMVGEECFKNLAMRSFFQNFERDENGSIINCKMHDIVHDFVQFLTENEWFVMEVNDSEESMLSHAKARHSMLMLAGQVSIPVSIKNVKNLRSLIIEWKGKSFQSGALSEIFDQLTCLKTLNMSGSSLTKFPKGVGKLIHLRYLNLTGNRELKELPETVCDLCNLQSLNVIRCDALQKLPHGLGKLINLRHLQIRDIDLSWMPKGVDRLSCLRTLDTFYVSSGVNDSEAASLAALKNLNHLRGRLEICGLGKVRDVDEVKKAQLENKEHLIGLNLYFSGGKVAEEGRMKNEEQVIEAIQPPPNLEQLSIFKYRGRSVFPNWMTLLTNLKKVEIRFCPNCEVLPPLGKLLSLESLVIWGMDSIKRVGIELLGMESEVNKNEGPSNTSSSLIASFPKLKELSFEYMENWEEWEDYGMRRRMGEEDITTATTNITIMPRLHSLWIIGCPKLKALPHHLLHKCPSLQKLEIKDSDILEERYHNGRRKGEEWPNISHIPNIIIGGDYVQRDGMQPQAGPLMELNEEISSNKSDLDVVSGEPNGSCTENEESLKEIEIEIEIEADADVA